MIAINDIIHLAGNLFSLSAEVGCGYLLFAAALIRRPSRDWSPLVEPVEPNGLPAVTILKPLHGDDSGLQERLLSFCDQRYPGSMQLVLGCQSRFDPAVAIARQVALLRPEREIDIVVDERLFGANRKVSNLVHCFGQARHDTLIIADSDIAVDADYVHRVVAALSQDGVGAVTCLYVGDGDSRAARLSALAIDAHFLPNVLVGMAWGAATPCFGSTIALRRETLERIGGLRAFVDKLADDYAIGAAVRKAGLRVAIPGFAVGHACSEPTFAAFFAHQLRVARTIRTIRPRGHVGSLITNPLPLAIIATALCGLATFWLVAAVLVARILLVAAVSRRFGGSRHNIWLLPICDIALFAVYVASFCGSQVDWRGHRFHSLADNSLVASKQGSTTA